jgi:predicted nucleic acid-binding protein
VTESEPVLLDTDTLSELSRGNATVAALARAYLRAYGRLTISSVTVFERLRGYRQAIHAGKPFHRQLHAFHALVQNSVVLPFDESAAEVSAAIWAACSRAQRQKLGDILIAGIAVARQIPLATRNQRDFEMFSKNAKVSLRLVDWTARAKRVHRVQ